MSSKQTFHYTWSKEILENCDFTVSLLVKKWGKGQCKNYVIALYVVTQTHQVCYSGLSSNIVRHFFNRIHYKHYISVCLLQ